MSSYTEAHKRYYETHKDQILDRTRDAHKERQRKWYKKNKRRLARERALKKTLETNSHNNITQS